MKKALFFALFGLILMGCNTKPTTQENTVVVKTETEELTGDELKIVATLKIKPEYVEKILPIFQAVVSGSQEEEGCIAYNLHKDISDPTRFIFIEVWKSQAAINSHNNSEHFTTFVKASADMIDNMEITILKLVY